MAMDPTKTATRYIPLAFAFSSLLSIPGCLLATNDDHVHPGSVVVDWTVDDFKDPGECRQSDASDIEILITTPRGSIVEQDREACEAFERVIDLPPGRYAGEATLLDPGGAPRTTTIDLGDFEIDEDSDTVIPINFPASSFL